MMESLSPVSTVTVRRSNGKLAASLTFMLIAAVTGTRVFGAPLVLNPGSYDISAQTLLPHLEENMRYATTRQRRCLGGQDVSALFPLFNHQALAGCALTHGQSTGQDHAYALTCDNPETATGTARVTVKPDTIRGMLEIKLGGKNMTMSQRINAQRLGVCQALE